MLINSAGFGSPAFYTDTNGVRKLSHTRLIPNRYFNYYYHNDGSPYLENSTGYSSSFGAARFHGGYGIIGGQNPANLSGAGGGIKCGTENYYVSDTFGGYNGMPSTWTILQRQHDTANWKYCCAIIELFAIYYDSQGYTRYLVTGYSTPSISTIESVGGVQLGLQVANATQISGNFYRYDIQATGLGNYRIAYFTIRTNQEIVAHDMPSNFPMYDTWKVNY